MEATFRYKEIKVSAILLAAGTSTRMGKDKLLLDYKGRSFLENALNLLSDLPVYERFLVTTDDRSKNIKLPKNVKMLINQNPEDGQSSSIRKGIEAATGTHYLFLTADQPKITIDDISTLLITARKNPDKIIFPTLDSKPGSPAIFPERFRVDLQKLSGEAGGRGIRDANIKDSFPVEQENKGNFVDIDDENDYRNLLNSENPNT